MAQVKWYEFEHDSSKTPPSDISNILTYGCHTIKLSNGTLLMGIDTKIYRSINNGDSYSLNKTFTNGHICKFWEDSWTSGKCYVCEKGGNIWYSTDYGLNWIVYDSGNTKEWWDVFQCPDPSHQDLLACYDGGAGVSYWMKWTGSAWANIAYNNQSADGGCAGFQVDGDPQGGGIGPIYASFVSSNTSNGLAIMWTGWTASESDFTLYVNYLGGGTTYKIDPFLNQAIKVFDDNLAELDCYFSCIKKSNNMHCLFYFDHNPWNIKFISEETNTNSRYILPLSQDYNAGEFHYIATVKYNGSTWTSKIYCFLENWSRQLSYLQSLDLFCYAIFSTPFFLATDTQSSPTWYRHYGIVDKGSEIEETIFTYEVGNITEGRIVSERKFGTNQTLIIYDADDTLLFRGFMKKRTRNGDKFIYSLKSFDKEIVQAKITATFTNKTTNEILTDIIVKFASFLYIDSSLSTFTATHSIKFYNRTIRSILNTLMNLEDGIWYVDPSGKLYVYKLTDIVDSTITVRKTVSVDTQNYSTIPKPTLIPAEYNKINLYGGIVNGIRLQNEDSYGNDLEAQLMNGIIEYVVHMPHLMDQTSINNAADDLLNRTGLSGNPIYFNWSLKEEGYVQAGKKLQCQFSAYSEMISLTYYYLLRYQYNPMDENGEIFCSSGLIQESTVQENEIHQTSDADEEQIDILAAAAATGPFPIGIKVDYFGTGIKGTIATRDYEISIANGDDFDMIGWFVANGEVDTPDCIDKFTRGEATSGVEGGSDDAIVVSHDHSYNSANEPGLFVTPSGSVFKLVEKYGTTTGGAGVSGVGKNIPAKISAIPIIRMS